MQLMETSPQFNKDRFDTLSIPGYVEEQIRPYDKLALEDHSYEATLGERRRWEKNLHIVSNEEGKQDPITPLFS